MVFWKRRYIIILLLICFSISVFSPISLAQIENDSKQQAFLDFEKKVFSLIASGMEPLSKLDKLKGKIYEEDLYNIALSAEEKLADNSLTLAKLRVPTALPDDIRTSLEEVKGELSIGFKVLGESMNYFARYIASHKPIFYNKYIVKRNKGFLYVDGGLTLLATIRLRLNATKRSIPDVWQMRRGYFYQLEKAIPIKSTPDGR